MQSVYRKLFEVEILHDYFLLSGPGQNFPKDYNISDVFNIRPSFETERLMRNYKLIFKATRTGFSIYIQAEFIDLATGYAMLVNPDPQFLLSFYWTLRDPLFVNYTNHRLKESGKKIYYFSNRSASQQGGITYLNQAIPSFGTLYPGETDYHLGDIVSRGGRTRELITMLAPSTGFTASQWQTINTAITNYVNPSDRLAWQSVYYQHKRPNTSPGEFINYKVFNAEGQPIDLGYIPGTNLPQSEYRAPLHSIDPVNYTLDLGSLKPGKYSMEITELGGTTSFSIYLLDTTIQPDLFAVSEFFISGINASNQFLTKNVVLNRWLLDSPSKKFMVRFRNRLTKWQYFKQDHSLFHLSDPRPLTNSYSGYKPDVGGTARILPDPSVNRIVPEINTPTQHIQNIFSPIFLNI